MTPLRQKMIDAMRQRGFSIRTHESYLHAVTSFARFYRRSLEDADADDAVRYFEYLVRERDLSPSTCRVHSEATLEQLRRYWSLYRPTDWLFPNENTQKALHVSTPQKVYNQCKQAAGIEKQGGIHALRHAFTTHQLEAGMPVHKLQHVLGHRSLESTMRYVH